MTEYEKRLDRMTSLLADVFSKDDKIMEKIAPNLEDSVEKNLRFTKKLIEERRKKDSTSH